MNRDLVAIFEHMEREKGIQRELLIQAIESALVVAARKSIKGDPNLSVVVQPKTGDIEIHCEKEIVERVIVPAREISLLVAQQLDPDCKIGQFIDVPLPVENFGRIAAQTARQVISQYIRGAEKEIIHNEYRHKIGEIVSGVVVRIFKKANLAIDLGKVEAILPMRNYPKTEQYQIGSRINALLLEVREVEDGGAEVVLSRSHSEFVRKLFMQEVPELHDHSITIENIVRDAGYRTKLLVQSSNPKIDPVGACVGVRGSRVKIIINELNNEKIDIIPYSKDTITLLQNILAPLEIRKIAIHEEDRVIAIVIDDKDFPAVLGKRGMNARLTGQLIGYELEVQRMSEFNKSQEIIRMQMAESTDDYLDAPLHIEGESKLVTQSLVQSGFNTLRDLLKSDIHAISEKSGINIEIIKKILEQLTQPRS